MAEPLSSSRYFLSSSAYIATAADQTSFMHRVDQLELSNLRPESLLPSSSSYSPDLESLYQTHCHFFQAHDAEEMQLSPVTDRSNETYHNGHDSFVCPKDEYSHKSARLACSEVSSLSSEDFSSSSGVEDMNKYHEDSDSDRTSDTVNHESTSYAGEKKKAKVRSKAKNNGAGKFTDTKIGHLTKWFLENRLKPYPSTQTKAQLAKTLKLSYSQICDWFTNKRKRHWTPVFKHGARPPRDDFESMLITENPDTNAFLLRQQFSDLLKVSQKRTPVARKAKKLSDNKQESCATQTVGRDRLVRLTKVEALQRISMLHKDMDEADEIAGSSSDFDFDESSPSRGLKRSSPSPCMDFHVNKKGKSMASNYTPTVSIPAQHSLAKFDSFKIFDDNFDDAIWGSNKDSQWPSSKGFAVM